MNGKGRSAASATKDPSAPKSRARFARKILPREWTDTPIITSIPKILSSLGDGMPVPGNLLFSADPNVITEVQAIWNAYELTDDFTVAILAPPNAVGPTVSVWWYLDKKKPLPFRYKCTTHQTFDFDGPVPRPPQVVSMLETKGPPLQTLRLLAPAHYRKHVAGVDKLDSPSSVISEWAQHLGCPVSALTGGTLMAKFSSPQRSVVDRSFAGT